ncbi:hypothetical protein SBRCBS47491_001483 [Sporothrix bragantina]|uniref:Zn(2)-C6 fungal-type domain-containing protein n=1 Tax=Sporothrix bragantina TaxID=671064 RepID=A0ABP0AZ62_9PEZI
MASDNAAAGNGPRQFFMVTDIEASSKGRQRVRVSRACDRCKQRKIRCTGTQPCSICIGAGAACGYNAPYSRGREPARESLRARVKQAHATRQAQPSVWSPQSAHSTASVASGPVPVTPSLNNGSGNHINALETSPTTTTSGGTGEGIAYDGPAFGIDVSVPGTVTRPEDAATQLHEPASRGSPDGPTTDIQGHYVGPASGLSFLLRIQKRLLASDPASPSSTAFTFGDAPLPDYDPMPSVMLSAETASTLVARFFDYTMPVDRFFHRPTIEAWLQEFVRTMGDMDNPDTYEARDRRAVLWMIFAMAQEHMEQGSRDDKSIRYFLAAKYQLSKTYGTVTLARLQARLCQCYWLLGRSRVNHCWELFGSTARLALALGLHRRRFGRQQQQQEQHPDQDTMALHIELSRKTFWSAYYLDTYLTMALGRPPIFHNDDIDQEMPLAIDDDMLQAQMPQADSSFSVALAPVAFYKLARIQNQILRDLYPIRPLSDAQQCNLASQHAQTLAEWRADLPAFLSVDSKDSVPLIPIFQRQRDTLSIAYWHSIILVQRPFLLMSFGHVREKFETQIANGVRQCLEAALHAARLVEIRCRAGQMSRSFWGSFYFGFTASVVLYVYTIQKVSSSPSVYQSYWDAATQCHDQMARVTRPKHIGARYCLVLEMLQLEAKRKIDATALGSLATYTVDWDTSGNTASLPTEVQNNDDNGENGGIGATDSLSQQPVEWQSIDWTNWVEFESMVSTSLF